MSLVSRTRQRFSGWWIVSVTAVLYGYGAGVNFYGFGVFFNPMREEFGWSRAATAGVFSLATQAVSSSQANTQINSELRVLYSWLERDFASI